jgi:hypothetical protein
MAPYCTAFDICKCVDSAMRRGRVLHLPHDASSGNRHRNRVSNPQRGRTEVSISRHMEPRTHEFLHQGQRLGCLACSRSAGAHRPRFPSPPIMFPVINTALMGIRVSCFRLNVHAMPSGKDVAVSTAMTLCRTDATDSTVLVFAVVPVHEGARPLACLLQIRKSLSRYHGPLLGIGCIGDANAISEGHEPVSSTQEKPPYQE